MDCTTAVMCLFLLLLLINERTSGQQEMLPFGYHADPTIIENVKAEDSMTPEFFVNNYFKPAKPVIFRSAAVEWPAFEKWTDDFLKEKYAKLELRIDGRKDVFTEKPPQGDICLGRDSLAHFINTYKNPDVNKFVDSELPFQLYKYVNLPATIGGSKEMAENLIEVDLLMSSGKMQTLLAKNLLSTVTCSLNGTKEWKLVERAYSNYMYEVWRGDNHEKSTTLYSLVNAKKVDLKRYPNVAKIPKLLTASLNAGDCLYLPSGYWHTVSSSGEKCVDVRFVIPDAKELDFTDMDESTPHSLPLQKAKPQWVYKGSGRMSKGNFPFSYYTDKMNSFFSTVDHTLKYDNVVDMLQFLTSYLPYSELHVNDRARNLYDELVALAGNNPVIKENIAPKLTVPKLRELINEYIQPPIAANHYDHEYTYFDPEKVEELFHNISSQNDGMVQKDKFVESYVNMGGHPTIANTTWEKFAPDLTEVDFTASKKYIHRYIGKAVENFGLYWRHEDEIISIYDTEDVSIELPPFSTDDSSKDSIDDLTRDEL